MQNDILTIGGKELRSRLFLGTGKFPSNDSLRDSIIASSADVVTVAVRRVDPTAKDDGILSAISHTCTLMPNTSGARNADEAVRIARLARAAGCGNWIKIEVISDSVYLLPDNDETLKATDILVKEGFVVLPYMSPDLYAARRMRDAGAAAIMPLGSPIGSGRGVKTKELVRIMIDQIDLPIIVDAGIGLPSEACECMEMGCAAVLVNTAVATARDPAAMAKAFADAVCAGRTAYLHSAVFSSDSAKAHASSPLTGFLHADA